MRTRAARARAIATKGEGPINGAARHAAALAIARACCTSLPARACFLQLIIPHSQSGGAAAEDEEKKDWKFGRNEGPMTWPWKLMCAILYMLPWVDVTEKTVYLVERFPAFLWTEYFTGRRAGRSVLVPARNAGNALLTLPIGPPHAVAVVAACSHADGRRVVIGFATA